MFNRFHIFVLGLFSCCWRINAFFENSCFQLEDDSCPNSNITFWLYSSHYPAGIQLKGIDSLQFNPAIKIKILIHGYDADRSTTPNLEIRPALLELPNINVLSLDYSNLVLEPCYTEAVKHAPIVGRCLGQFLFDAVKRYPQLLKKLHLIGYGIGAHVAAFAGNFMTQLGLHLPHITGLDPGKLLYLTPNISHRLDSSDADFVDIIHTDIFMHGLMQHLGHVDFYPNKGLVQPNCGPIDELSTHQCYHRRSAEYYAESIRFPGTFLAFYCKDLYAFVTQECNPNDNIEEMGYYTKWTAKGRYFLETNDKPPYARGSNFSNMDRSIYGKTYLTDDLIRGMVSRLGPAIRKLASNFGK